MPRRLLPRRLADARSAHGTPARLTIGFGILIAILAAFVPLRRSSKLVNIGTLFAFVLVNIGVIVLRRTRPDMQRAVPRAVVAGVPDHRRRLCVFLMKDLPGTPGCGSCVWLVVGLAIYFLYGHRHSRLRRGEVTNPEADLA